MLIFFGGYFHLLLSSDSPWPQTEVNNESRTMTNLKLTDLQMVVVSRESSWIILLQYVISYFIGESPQTMKHMLGP